MSGRGVLVAGIGNLFLTDDGFGSEVARRLAAESLPEGVRVIDYGIRGMHLAYDLLDGYDALVVVDALPATVPPGTCPCWRSVPRISARASSMRTGWRPSPFSRAWASSAERSRPPMSWVASPQTWARGSA